MMAIVFSSICAATSAGRTVAVSGSTGTRRTSMPNRWLPLSNAAWAVSGFTMFGLVMPRTWRAWSR